MSETPHGFFLVVPNRRHHLVGVTLLAQIASGDVLDAAYEWLCRRWRDYSANAEVWAFRGEWKREKEPIKN